MLLFWLHFQCLLVFSAVVYPFYYPASEYHIKAIGSSLTSPKAALAKELGIEESQLRITIQFTDAFNIQHVYFERVLHNLAVLNHDAAIHIKDGRIVSFATSFSKAIRNLDPIINSNGPVIPLNAAINKAVKLLDAPLRKNEEEFYSVVQMKTGHLAECYTFYLDNMEDKWLHVSVNIRGGDIVQVVNYYSHASSEMPKVSESKLLKARTNASLDGSKIDAYATQIHKASYHAIKLPNVSPLQGFTSILDPADSNASSEGWHSDECFGWEYNHFDYFWNEAEGLGGISNGTLHPSITCGNNAVVYPGTWPPNNENMVDAPEGPDFDFNSNWSDGSFLNTPRSRLPIEINQAISAYESENYPQASHNRRAAAVHLFYIINTLHDIFYNYGFTDASGNFERECKSGYGRDEVVAHTTNTLKNIALFASPPDGQIGRMHLSIFEYGFGIPRDAALDSMLLIHEYTHGLTSRLTGGAMNARCLASFESSGLAEGWSDAIAIFLSHDGGVEKEIAFAAWISFNTKSGLRRYPYTTSIFRNPLLFSGMMTLKDVHQVGEIWASILNEVYWSLVNSFGFSRHWEDSTQTEGNIVMLQLIFGGLIVQPCNPTFIQARDAIIHTDKLYYDDLHLCELWNGFSKRGLGIKAHYGINNFEVPPFCQ